jgi:microcystin-dependent protein
MPYDPAGNFSLVPSYKATPGQTIRTEQHNPPLEDIGQALSSVLVRDGRNGMVGPLNMGSFPVINLKPGTASTDAATVGQVLGSGPIGIIAPFAGDNAPAGWMLCFGQAISRTEYAQCFAVLGTKFGAGNGTTTFNLPDMRGRIAVGRDNIGGTPANRITTAGSGINGTVIGAVGGAESVKLTVAQMPSHNHGGTTGAAGAHSHTFMRPRGDENWENGNRNAWWGSNNVTETTSAAPNHTHSISAEGGGQAHLNVQPTLILNYIIRVSA